MSHPSSSIVPVRISTYLELLQDLQNDAEILNDANGFLNFDFLEGIRCVDLFQEEERPQIEIVGDVEMIEVSDSDAEPVIQTGL